MQMSTFADVLSVGATIAFSAAAVLAVRKDREIDLFGVTVLGIITAVGGGTIRDVIAGVPVFWMEDPSYVWIALVAAVVAFYARKPLEQGYVQDLMLYVDAAGAAMFGIQATGKIHELGLGGDVGAILLGVTTAIGGGLIRDTLAGRPNLLLLPELYAVPVMLGCSAYVAVLHLDPTQHLLGANLCILGTFLIRAAAIRWHISMPAVTRL